jgi:hypothetical protein
MIMGKYNGEKRYTYIGSIRRQAYSMGIARRSLPLGRNERCYWRTPVIGIGRSANIIDRKDF